ncbi:macrophage mannose receptor 1-like [Anticarsia gemmatalis]|uniref:macrophage mannose receptor 1-like n=1 Tax=Anticarsia gemmatalis TaxID=129554 RepID=UPI003F76F2E9
MKYSLTALLIVCITSLEAVKFRCDYTYNGSGWYKYHTIPLPWREARLMCYHEGAMLASPVNHHKIEMLNMLPTSDVFTGFNAISKGHYYSVDGIPLDSTPHVWAPKQPDNKNDAERCLTMSPDGKLSDVKCEEPRPFMCYRKDSKVDVNACGTTDPEYKYQPLVKKCYKFHLNRGDHQGARFACSAEGGRLAMVTNEKEENVTNNIVMEYLDKLGAFQLLSALTIMTPENSWVNEEGLNMVAYSLPRLAPGKQGKDVSKVCLSRYRGSGLLQGLACDSFNFICEKDPAYPRVCTKEETMDRIIL